MRAKQQKGNATVQVRLPGGRLRACRCTPHDVDAYRSRISGPLLDRIDLHVEVPALAYEELVTAPLGEGTAPVRARVEKARAAQRERLKVSAIYCNAQMGAREVHEHCRHDEGGARLLEGAMRALARIFHTLMVRCAVKEQKHLKTR